MKKGIVTEFRDYKKVGMNFALNREELEVMTENKKHELLESVLGYLQKNPAAGDTLEGIATWWLEQVRIEQVVEEVAEALQELVDKGVIQASKTQGGATIFKINKNLHVKK